MTFNKILKAHNLNSDQQFYDKIAFLFVNNQRFQAINLFKVMPRQNRIEFLKSACVGGWKSGIPNHELVTLFELL